MTAVLDQCHPNVVAEQITGRDYISFSAISTYMQCPLRYLFKYVEGLPEETISSSLAFGGGIHASLEFHFNELMAGNPTPDHDTLLSVFWQSWNDRRDQAAIAFGKGEDVNSIGQLADGVLREFSISDLADAEGRILGVEEELRGKVVAGVPDLLARVDLIVETDDALKIIDFKTARNPWKNEQAQDQAEQLLLYSELAKELAPSKPLALEFAVITKTKTPVVENHAVNIDAQRITRTKEIVQRVWRSIESGHSYPTPSPIACGSCPFRQPCRRWCG